MPWVFRKTVSSTRQDQKLSGESSGSAMESRVQKLQVRRVGLYDSGFEMDGRPVNVRAYVGNIGTPRANRIIVG